MAFFRTTSLAASDHNKFREDNHLMKNLKTRISKQHLVEHKMFGSKRKNIQLGKTFKKSGKGIINGSLEPHMEPKEHGISPSLEEFDRMMESMSTKGTKFPKTKNMFRGKRKYFG